jgi:hypothetical protein
MPKRKYQKPLKLDLDFNEALERFAQTDPAEVRQEIAKAVQDQRVRLVQREEGGHPLLIYGTDRGVRVDLAYRGQTLWATQQQMSDMFGVNVPSVSRHIKNIFEEGELDPTATVSKTERVGLEGHREVKREIELYNLNAMISVGYRVGSKQGTLFRIWATDMLVQILTKGFYIDVDRLKAGNEEQSILDDLRDAIREIRASTANIYREVKRICTLCNDYDGTSQTARNFFMGMENKLLWVATSHTGPELIVERADATKDAMGLTYYAGKRGPTQADVKIANNYLAEPEAKQKNRATVMLLDYFEEQLEQGRLVTMAEATSKLVDFIKFNKWPLLTHNGRVLRDTANEHALRQLALFKTRLVEEGDEPKKLEKKG